LPEPPAKRVISIVTRKGTGRGVELDRFRRDTGIRIWVSRPNSFGLPVMMVQVCNPAKALVVSYKRINVSLKGSLHDGHL
jgi:hypothetical protein